MLLSARLFHPLVMGLIVIGMAGCTSTAMRSNEDFRAELLDEEELDRPKLVGDYCRPWGDHYLVVRGVTLVHGLRGTGSDPPPGAAREMLLAEMRRRQVEGPNSLLADPNTSLVVVQAFIPPGARKGDRLDVEVRVPTGSETTSLEGGWLLETRLEEMAVLGNQVRTGHVGALAQGPVVTAALMEGENDASARVRGTVLGGAVVVQDRPLGLLIKEQHHHVAVSTRIGDAINRRFHTYASGSKRGAATPKRDSYLELDLHHRYRFNVNRYLRVVENIPLRDDMETRTAWLAKLEGQLLDRRTAAHAALQLEALGDEAISVLNRGLASRDPEVRFYSAEALAYLDQAHAAPHLMEAARDESAFRWHALTALSIMSDLDAHDALCSLLNQPSAETRYGAFRALQAMNPHDPTVKPKTLGETVIWHEVRSEADALVHVARSRRPEIVAFGGPIGLGPFSAVFAGPYIMIKPITADEVQVARYAIGGDSQVRQCGANLREVVEAVVDVGGTYSDLVQMMLEMDRQKVLQARLVFDAIPRSGRTYIRKDLLDDASLEELAEELAEDQSAPEALPLPSLFSAPSDRDRQRAERFADEDL